MSEFINNTSAIESIELEFLQQNQNDLIFTFLYNRFLFYQNYFIQLRFEKFKHKILYFQNFHITNIGIINFRDSKRHLNAFFS